MPARAAPESRSSKSPPELEPLLRNVIEWSDSPLAHARELVNHRELLWLVTLREIKVRYKQTALGATWAVLQPFSLMLVFALFFSHFAGMKGDPAMPYAVFSYTGLLAWTFFSTSLSFAIHSLIANSYIITKIYFPREIVPLSCVLAALVDFAVAALIFIGLLAWYRVAPTWNVLYAVPLLLIQVTFTIGVCLWLSAFTVLYRDARFALPLLIQIWMFATPILYSPATVAAKGRGFYAAYMTLNPMAVIIDGYRRCVAQGRAPDVPLTGVAALISLAVLWLSYRYFKRLERRFADLA